MSQGRPQPSSWRGWGGSPSLDGAQPADTSQPPGMPAFRVQNWRKQTCGVKPARSRYFVRGGHGHGRVTLGRRECEQQASKAAEGQWRPRESQALEKLGQVEKGLATLGLGPEQRGLLELGPWWPPWTPCLPSPLSPPPRPRPGPSSCTEASGGKSLDCSTSRGLVFPGSLTRKPGPSELGAGVQQGTPGQAAVALTALDLPAPTDRHCPASPTAQGMVLSRLHPSRRPP